MKKKIKGCLAFELRFEPGTSQIWSRSATFDPLQLQQYSTIKRLKNHSQTLGFCRTLCMHYHVRNTTWDLCARRQELRINTCSLPVLLQN